MVSESTFPSPCHFLLAPLWFLRELFSETTTFSPPRSRTVRTVIPASNPKKLCRGLTNRRPFMPCGGIGFEKKFLDPAFHSLSAP